jgi:threonylcarbamoyladenosine tRNA methylthiotransferase MtaB
MDSEPRIVTFGCRLNTSESEVMRLHARAAGLSNTIIFNTCGVTSEAERQARQAIRRARREHPDAEIVVTGCAVEISRDTFSAMPEITRIVSNAAKLKPESWHEEGTVDIPVVGPVTEFSGLARGFVEVQTGCDHACTFCVIPIGRGPSRSVPIGEIVSRTRALVEQGYREIVLTGVDITSFGGDLPGQPTLGSMVRRLLALVPDLPRLRLSSLDPAEIDDDLWALIDNEPRLMPHLHISMQSGDDMILKRMKRRHDRGQGLELCRRARASRRDIALGADFIAGFPTETDDMHRRTMEFVEEAGLTYLHVFPYSSRPGTPAARMPSLSGETVKRRAADLRALGQRRVGAFLAGRIGQTEAVLVECEGVGRTAHFAETRLPTGLQVGSVVPFHARSIEQTRLVGDVGH